MESVLSDGRLAAICARYPIPEIRNEELLIAATHRRRASLGDSSEDQKAAMLFQRFEALGDSAVSYAIMRTVTRNKYGTFYFREAPSKDIGIVVTARELLENNRFLARLAILYRLHHISEPPISRSITSLGQCSKELVKTLADMLEAHIGALCMDGESQESAVREWMDKIFGELLEAAIQQAFNTLAERSAGGVAKGHVVLTTNVTPDAWQISGRLASRSPSRLTCPCRSSSTKDSSKPASICDFFDIKTDDTFRKQPADITCQQPTRKHKSARRYTPY